MPSQHTSGVPSRATQGPVLARALLDGLVELCRRRDLDGLQRPRLRVPPGPPLLLHREGVSACPLCGGPRRVYRIGGPDCGAAGRSHFCARCWQLDLVDGEGRRRGHATRRLEKLMCELPSAARPSSLAASARVALPGSRPAAAGLALARVGGVPEVP